MFTAWGAGATKNRNNTITVKVKILDDAGVLVEVLVYTARDLDGIKALIAADLVTRKAAQTDATLQAAVVDKELGSI